jgi:hypothetical protein
MQIKILMIFFFPKKNNKYRFNQFWDITKDRAEFPIGSDYPPTGPVIPGTTIIQGSYSSNNIWITASNGVTRILNPNLIWIIINHNYRRKKFRHYINFLNLSRVQCNDVNMILKFSNSKNEYSPR